MPAAPSPDSSVFTYFSVHALRPADIQVVAALGDSLTVRTFEPPGGGARWGHGIVGVSVGQGCGGAFQVLALLHLKPALPPSTISLPSAPALSVQENGNNFIFATALSSRCAGGKKIFFRNELNILSWQRF